MRTRFLGLTGLALGLALLGGGAAASARGSTAVPLSASASTRHYLGAGLSAPLFQLATAANSASPATGAPAVQDPACATQGQDGAGGADTNTAGAADTDNVDLQCGDQTGADTGSAADSGPESATETDASGSDPASAVDTVDQQGQN